MLGLEAMDSSTTPGKALNSRAFTAENEGPLQSIIYVLVSIMSAQYHTPSSVKHMMLESHKAYGNSDIPIVYVCGDTVYNITKPFLFKETGRDPVERGRTKWLDQYNKTFHELETEGSKLHHKIVYWDTIKNTPDCLNIRKFTDVVFNRDLTLEILQENFPGASEKKLQALMEDRQSTKILENVPVIANEFRSKNLIKVEKRTKKEEKDTLNLRAQLAKAGIVGSGIQVNSNSSSGSHTPQGNLMLATHEYLSEEFSVFLLLSFLQHGPKINTTFNLQSSALGAHPELKPVLSYPISTTKGSDTIFATFRAVEMLYLNYCTLLDLPVITQPVTIIDPFTPGIPYENTSFLEMTHRNEMRSDEISQRPTNVSTRSTPSPALPFFSSVAQLENDIDRIVQQIIKKIDKHLESKSIEITTRTLYKNGVTCEIISSNRLNTEHETTSLSDITMFITSAVCDVKEKNSEGDEVIFNYKNHSFVLAVKPTAPSPTLNREAQSSFFLPIKK